MSVCVCARVRACVRACVCVHNLKIRIMDENIYVEVLIIHSSLCHLMLANRCDAKGYLKSIKGEE